MGWKLAEKPKTQMVTKVLAKSFAEMDPAPHDRPLSERRLMVYQKLLAAGLFRPVTWAVATCKETGGTYRVNGKHTSTLLSGLDKLPEFYVTIERYLCDTLEDVAKLYSTFDSNMQSRSSRDIYLSFAGTVTELKGLPARTIQACATGMSYHLLGEVAHARSQPADRAELLLEHPEFVIWVHKVAGGGNLTNRSQVMHRLPVVAAMFGTWTKAKAAATEFWTAVRDESGAKPDLPDRKIARWLVTSSLSKKEYARIRKAGERETYVKCLHAWNAWRNETATSLQYHPDAKVPAIS